MPDGESVERGERETVVPLELFFDLVFVFAFTQVTTLLSDDPTWGGVLRAALLLSVLWWAWSAYAWLTNTLDPEEGGVRLVMFAAIAAMVIASLAAPLAFGRDAAIFAVAYLIVRALHLVLYAIAGRGDPELLRAVLRIVPSVFLSAALLIVASPLHGTAKLVCWGVAAAVDYLGPLIGHMRGWRLSPSHFVERFGQVILIALGESVIAIGVGAAGLELDPGLVGAVLLGVTIAACLWWSYFDWVFYIARSRLIEATGARRAALARDAYSYLHLPMVGGIVLFAFVLGARHRNVVAARPRVRAHRWRRALPPRPRRAPTPHRRRTRTRATDRVAGPRRLGARGHARSGRGSAGHGRRGRCRTHHVRSDSTPRGSRDHSARRSALSTYDMVD